MARLHVQQAVEEVARAREARLPLPSAGPIRYSARSCVGERQGMARAPTISARMQLDRSLPSSTRKTNSSNQTSSREGVTHRAETLHCHMYSPPLQGASPLHGACAGCALLPRHACTSTTNLRGSCTCAPSQEPTHTRRHPTAHQYPNQSTN